MKALQRAAHYLLLFVLTAILLRAMYLGFSSLRAEQHSQLPADDAETMAARKPSPQEIVCCRYWLFLDMID
jgi:hypothetical protein